MVAVDREYWEIHTTRNYHRFELARFPAVISRPAVPIRESPSLDVLEQQRNGRSPNHADEIETPAVVPGTSFLPQLFTKCFAGFGNAGRRKVSTITAVNLMLPNELPQFSTPRNTGYG